MSDVVEFAAPLGLLGGIAEMLALRHYMPKLIMIRNQHIKQIAEVDPTAN